MSKHLKLKLRENTQLTEEIKDSLKSLESKNKQHFWLKMVIIAYLILESGDVDPVSLAQLFLTG